MQSDERGSHYPSLKKIQKESPEEMLVWLLLEQACVALLIICKKVLKRKLTTTYGNLFEGPDN